MCLTLIRLDCCKLGYGKGFLMQGRECRQDANRKQEQRNQMERSPTGSFFSLSTNPNKHPFGFFHSDYFPTNHVPLFSVVHHFMLPIRSSNFKLCLCLSAGFKLRIAFLWDRTNILETCFYSYKRIISEVLKLRGKTNF